MGAKAQVSDIKQPALCQQIPDLSLHSLSIYTKGVKHLRGNEMPEKEKGGRRKKKKEGGKLQTGILTYKVNVGFSSPDILLKDELIVLKESEG